LRRTPIEERLVRLDVERGAHLGARRLDGVAHPLGDDQRRIGEPMVGAPAFERQRCAVMAQEIGVEALDQRQRFEPADKAGRPRRRPGGKRGRRPQQQ